MKETGLIFKAPLVRALLDGRKTQTRRIAKPVRHPDLGNVYSPGALVLEHEPQHVINRACPYGQPGDRIYVRESFVQGYEEDPLTGRLKQWDDEGNSIPLTTWFRATDTGLTWSDDGESEVNVPWKPATHMPKKLARIWLEITGVRMEQLQDISTEDCISEGLNTTLREYDAEVNLRDQFQELWESTGGDWDANPWVWVVDFKVLSTTGRPA